MVNHKKAMKTFGRNTKDVLIVSKQAIRHESPILIKKGVKVLKKHVKKRKVAEIRKLLGWKKKQ